MAIFPPKFLKPRLDINKYIKIYLVYNMAELFVGDITPANKIPKKKIKRETLIINHIVELLDNIIFGNDKLHIL